MSDFLTRWSRRKRAAEAEVGEAPVAEAASVQEVGKPAAAQPERPPLPNLADISADTDIRGFLAPDVAPELKKAALRRAWAADPAVRDFVGPARDYAYDWNTPGGVPGFGPLTPAAVARVVTSVEEMLTRIEPIGRDAPMPTLASVDEHPISEEQKT
jgi:hypothetical protein